MQESGVSLQTVQNNLTRDRSSTSLSFKRTFPGKGRAHSIDHGAGRREKDNCFSHDLCYISY